MRSYSKACVLADLRRFPGWSQAAAPQERELSDDDIVYLADDFVVMTDPIREEGVIFDQVSAGWREFCTGELGFAIPDDLTYQRPESGKEPASGEDSASEELQHG